MLGTLGLPLERPTATQTLDMPSPGDWRQRIALCPVRRILAENAGGRLRFWDAVTLQPRGSVRFRGGIQDLAFTPDGETLLLLQDGNLRLWPWRALIEEGYR